MKFIIELENELVLEEITNKKGIILCKRKNLLKCYCYLNRPLIDFQKHHQNNRQGIGGNEGRFHIGSNTVLYNNNMN